MKTKQINLLRLLLIVCFIACFSLAAFAQTTAFTYQGRFTDSSTNPPTTNGSYTMTFKLYDAQSTGNLIGTQSALVSVVNGIFSVKLDFGAAAFNTSDARYLEIQVGSTILTPRQEITSTPFSVRAVNAASADSLSSTCVECVTNTQINSVDGSKITGTINNATVSNATNASNFSGTLSGNVTGTQNATVVSSVGGQSAASIASAVTTVGNATNLNNANAIVRRDGSGNFVAGQISATVFNGNLNGNAATAATATNFSGTLSGDVGGTQGATVIQANAVTAGKIASNQVVKSLNGLKDSVTLAGGSGITVSPSGNTLTLTLTTPFKKYVVGGLVGGFQFDVPHNLNTQDVIVQVYNQDGSQINIGTTVDASKYDGFVKIIDANTVRVGILLAGTYRVTIIG